MNVKIYTLDYCPYCRNALKFLADSNIQYEQIRIDDNEDYWLNYLKNEYSINGEVTVPQIIIEGKRIGGYTDMMKKQSEGKLF